MAGGPQADDVVVVGAGPWGLAAAWRLAARGARVRVLDDERQPAGAVAAGMLAPWSEATAGEPGLFRLLLAAWRTWPAFAGELEAASEIGVGLRATGAAYVAARPEQVPSVRRLAATLADLGEPAEWTPPSALRAWEEGLGPAVAGGLLLPGEGQVDPRLVLAALRVAAGILGVRVAAAEAVGLLRGPSGRVRGVRLGDETTLVAGRVVLAAGAAAGRLAARVPLRPMKGQILRLGPRPGLAGALEHTIRTPEAYLVPRADGRIVLGATMEEAGDRTVTAGGVHELLDEAVRAVPGLREMALEECSAGLRPATPDGLPALGEDPDDGLVWAVGGFRHGILLTPLAAAAAAAAAEGRPTPAPAAGLGPERFPAVALGAGCA